MATILEAAQELIKQLSLPAVMHAVWVQTSTDPETKDFKQTLKVAIRPGYKINVKIPSECMGHPVEQEPWPKKEKR
jgi:glucose-6-phosphate dehydrogenase assembly protein OpcA